MFLGRGFIEYFSCVSVITFFCKNDKQNANKFMKNYNWAFVDKVVKFYCQFFFVIVTEETLYFFSEKRNLTFQVWIMTCFPSDLLTHMQKGDSGTGAQDDRGQGSHQEEEDRVTELPEIPQLQHLAKARPKRPKKHASSKNVVKVISP